MTKSNLNKRFVTAVPADKFGKIRLTGKKNYAAGMPAVISSLKHLKREVGLFKGIKVLSRMNKKNGFDCPGCAWPDPDGKRSTLGEYCENGVKAIAEEITVRRVDAEFFRKNNIEELSKQSDFWIGKQGRITEPMILEVGSKNFKPISWDAAFNKIGNQLKSLNSPDEAVFYTSGRTSNEAAYMYQLFARQIGTNNLPDCSNMCHESSGIGLGETVGIGKGSVKLEDLHEAEVIIVMGQNPGTNHPRMLSALAKCKTNGGTVVSINPIPEAGNEAFADPQDPVSMIRGGEKLTDLYLQVKINGDVAVLKAACMLMLEAEKINPGTVFDLDFIEKNCDGYEILIADLETTSYEDCIKQSGVQESQVRQFADLLIKNKKIIICWAMGITQHKNGVENVREIVNTLLLKGSIGKPGAGTCPARGHSNVQGDRTMGIWEKPKSAFLESLDSHFGINTPKKHGYDVVDCIEAMHNNKVKIFMAMGGNFVSATPDTEYTAEAIQKCELTVHVSTKLNRSHLIPGVESIILPCISRTESDTQESGLQFISVENSMGIVHRSTGKFPPASNNLKSEPAIIAGVANSTFGENSPVNWSEMVVNYDTVRNHIEATIVGFDDYNTRVRQSGGFYLPNGAREGQFKTATDKARFTINPLPDQKVKDGNLIMMTIRSHDQYNTTIYGMDDRYRGVFNERRVVFIHPEDMKNLGLAKLDIVNLKSHFMGEVREAFNFKIIPYDIARGCVATYFPETNVLVPLKSFANKSQTPVSKFVEIEISKV